MPFMTEDEFNELLEDAGINGFQNPVKVTNERLLIDGRNRICASIVLEKDVRIEEFTPSDPIQYVLSENLARRHLTSQQKAVVAIQAEGLYQLLAEQAKRARVESGGDRKSEDYQKSVSEKIHEPINAELSSPIERRTDTKLAKAFGTNQNYVAKAKKVKDHAPDLLQEIKAGNLDLNKAVNIAKQRQQESKGAMQEVGSPTELKLNQEVADLRSGIETFQENGYTLHVWHDSAKNSSFNQANESIDWAWSTWNPVTGCLHG